MKFLARCFLPPTFELARTTFVPHSLGPVAEVQIFRERSLSDFVDWMPAAHVARFAHSGTNLQNTQPAGSGLRAFSMPWDAALALPLPVRIWDGGVGCETWLSLISFGNKRPAGSFALCQTTGCRAMPSTSIKKTKYDPAKGILSVWFVTSGKRYEFEGVPPETFAAFRSAFAKGRFFNAHIRNRFRYRRVTSDDDD
ncbi:KTSC domain-containing protein [Mesorhizobium sp. WSM4898]|uniref:KTSC domain-containing protein n=1 Tax=Mesorhizobium sp. WSM4898 TaxID=3038544 RepID=UPI00241506F1|nr:KTSC domain-containing protein [Mesorhizobium sp. WSM4898]MDG4906932.1 KTSC domain-containing protein [Mesorhizobium sp. WSM4898]